jgi:hypothetical protein
MVPRNGVQPRTPTWKVGTENKVDADRLGGVVDGGGAVDRGEVASGGAVGGGSVLRELGGAELRTISTAIPTMPRTITATGPAGLVKPARRLR